MHARRRDRLASVAPEPDVLVIGGGINGAGVARDAALRGWRVVLFDKDDFGAGTSSRTSKLVHGGLRYLEHGALRLVWEACRERRILLQQAPHLVRPLPLVFPLYADSRFPPWKLRAGMWLYDLLATFRNVRPHRMLHPERAGVWRDGLRRDGLRTLALYYDACMDDARLVLANVLGAQEAGARTLNYAGVTRLLWENGRVCGVEVEDGTSGERRQFRAACVVACAGPWTNGLLAGLPGAPQPLAPTRGTHIVVRQLVTHGFTLAAGTDGRVFFVLPWLGLTLVGTTDVAGSDDPDAVAPTTAEIDYLLAETNRFFPEACLEKSDVIAAFAGLRPLLRADGSASARSREHALLEPMPGLLCVLGGKFTTYRAVAEEVVDRLEQWLQRRRPCRTAQLPLPGGDLPWGPQAHWQEGPGWRQEVERLAASSALDTAAVEHLVRTYGSRAEAIVTLAAQEPGAARRLCPHLPHLEAEVRFALREEMALQLEDWYYRRSRTAYHPCHGHEALERVAALYAAELGWTEAERTAASERLVQGLASASLTPLPPASSRSA